MPEQHAGQVNPDVLTLNLSEETTDSISEGSLAIAEASPKVSMLMTADEQATYRRLTVRHVSDHCVVAMIEVVSPTNKDRRRSVFDFVNKAVGVLALGHHLLVVDMLPPGNHDPDGIHGETWNELTGQPYAIPEDGPLNLAAYVAETLPRAYVEPTRVGQLLTDMPLFLDTDHYVNVPLEATYQMAVDGMPAFWRSILEA